MPVGIPCHSCGEFLIQQLMTVEFDGLAICYTIVCCAICVEILRQSSFTDIGVLQDLRRLTLSKYNHLLVLKMNLPSAYPIYRKATCNRQIAGFRACISNCDNRQAASQGPTYRASRYSRISSPSRRLRPFC